MRLRSVVLPPVVLRHVVLRHVVWPVLLVWMLASIVVPTRGAFAENATGAKAEAALEGVGEGGAAPHDRKMTASVQPRMVLVGLEVGQDLFEEGERSLLELSLAAELSKVNVLAFELAGYTDAADLASKSSEAGNAGWMLVTLSGSRENLQVEVSESLAREPGTVGEHAPRRRSFSYRTVVDPRLRVFAGRLWDRLRKWIVKTHHGPSGESVLTIRGVAGSTVQVSGGESASETELVLDSTGEASVEVPYPAEIQIRSRHRDCYPTELSVFVEGRGEHVQLSQTRRSRWHLETGFENGVFPSVRAFYTLGRYWFSLGAGVTTYLVGFAPFGVDAFQAGEETGYDEDDENRLVLDQPLSRFSAVLAFLIGPADRRLRGRIDLVPFARLYHATGYFGLEPVAPWGLEMDLGAVLRFAEELSLIASYAPTLYYLQEPRLYETFSDYGANWRLHIGEAFAVDLGSFRIGVRFEL